MRRARAAWSSTRRSREGEEIVISPAACGGSAGGREPPRWYGWWAKPLTARRLNLRQPCARALGAAQAAARSG